VGVSGCTAGSSRFPDVACPVSVVIVSLVKAIYHSLTGLVTPSTSIISIDWFEYGFLSARGALERHGNCWAVEYAGRTVRGRKLSQQNGVV
jgi:hypothetical protein